jgi:hypothetical protein
LSQYLGKTCPGDIHNPAYPGKFVTSINRIPLWLLIKGVKINRWQQRTLALEAA